MKDNIDYFEVRGGNLILPDDDTPNRALAPDGCPLDDGFYWTNTEDGLKPHGPYSSLRNCQFASIGIAIDDYEDLEPLIVIMSDILDAEYEGAMEVMRPYSGRGMCGNECLGIVFNDLVSGFEFSYRVGYTSAEENEDFSDIFENIRYDHMGTGVILYWPKIKLKRGETNA